MSLLSLSKARRFIAAACLVTATSVLAATPVQRRDAFQAAGEPILPACTSLRAGIDKLNAGLPVQAEWIARSEAQLKAANETYRGSQEELAGIALKAATLLAKKMLEAVKAAEDIVEAERGFSSIPRHEWQQKFTAIKNAAEFVQKAVKVGTAGLKGGELGAAISRSRATMADFVTFLNDSKIADEGAKRAAFLAAGPMGELVVETFNLSRDALFAAFTGKMSADEIAAHEQNLAGMRTAKKSVEDRIYEMETEMASPRCTPTPRPADRMNVIKEPEPPSSGAAGAAAPPTTTPGPSAGKMLGGLVLAGGAGVATYYYLDKALKKIEDGGSGGGGGGSVKATFVSMSGITCTFNAGGIISSCTGTITFDITGSLPTGTSLRFQFDAGPGGNKATTANPAGTVTFTISGGTATSTCPTLRTGTVLKTSTQESIGSFSNLPTSVTCR